MKYKKCQKKNNLTSRKKNYKYDINEKYNELNIQTKHNHAKCRENKIFNENILKLSWYESKF